MPPGIQGLFVGICLAQFGGGANGGNHPITDEHSAIWNDAQATEFMPALGCTGNGK
jgi:hypothetical protein